MVDVKVMLHFLSGERAELKNIRSVELNRESDAACDGLRIYFFSKNMYDEIVDIEVYIDDKKVFFGYVDTQREEINRQGGISFIYARSSACVLTDIEAKPTVLNYPSARFIFDYYIKKYGFTLGMNDLYGDGRYTVSKGTSLFGVLNDFVFSVSGKHIYITPDNEIRLLEEGKNRYITDSPFYEKRIINRGDALAYINYKVSSGANYNRCHKEENISVKGITRSVVKNLSGIEQWQREKVLFDVMKKANKNYLTYELRFYDYLPLNLYDKVYFRFNFDFMINAALVSGITYVVNENGIQTRIKLEVPIESRETDYVDE